MRKKVGHILHEGVIYVLIRLLSVVWEMASFSWFE